MFCKIKYIVFKIKILTVLLLSRSFGKVQLTMAINFFSSRDSEEIHTMHNKSDNIEILIANETYEVIAELFKSFFAKI